MKSIIVRAPLIGRFANIVYRSRLIVPVVARNMKSSLSWLFASKETTNFTYDLTERNIQHLAEFVSQVTGASNELALRYIRELQEDEELRKHIANMTAKSAEAFKSDNEARYGRRLGWYAVTRIMKPRVVVETGVEKGLGAVILCAALKRNSEEGFEGRYYGTDIDTRAGYLLEGDYKKFGTILYGDSIDSISNLDEMIDLFITDSDHTPGYEAKEYAVITPQLSENSTILSDNAHATDDLLDYSHISGRKFLFFREDPGEFWYPGGGIGAAFPASRQTQTAETRDEPVADLKIVNRTA